MTDTQRARIQRRRDGGSRCAGSGERLRRRTRSGCSHREMLRPPISCARVGPGRVLARCSVASRWCVVVSCSTSAGPAPGRAALFPDTLAESCGGWGRHPGDAEADHRQPLQAVESCASAQRLRRIRRRASPRRKRLGSRGEMLEHLARLGLLLTGSALTIWGTAGCDRPRHFGVVGPCGCRKLCRGRWPAAMGADAESSCTESRTDSWSPDGARNPPKHGQRPRPNYGHPQVRRVVERRGGPPGARPRARHPRCSRHDPSRW